MNSPDNLFHLDFMTRLARERQQDLMREAAERRSASASRSLPRTRRRFLRWP